MQKTVLLIDTENIGGQWADVLGKLNKTDDVILFYTVNSHNISIENLQTLVPFVNQLTFVKCEVGMTGRNALDFQLVSYLGFLLKTAAKTRFIIYSNDTGYDPVAEFWSKRDRNVIRMGKELLPEYREKVEPDAKENDIEISPDFFGKPEGKLDIKPADPVQKTVVVSETETAVKKKLSKNELKKLRYEIVTKELGREPDQDEFARIGQLMADEKYLNRDILFQQCKKLFAGKGEKYFDKIHNVIVKYHKAI